MASKSLFKMIAGKADNHFEIGDIEFYAAPLTIRENAEYEEATEALELGLFQAQEAEIQRRAAITPADLGRVRALQQLAAENQAKGIKERNAFLASKLKNRIKTPGKDVDMIDEAWVETNVWASQTEDLVYVLVWGYMRPPAKKSSAAAES